jgi:hypothetical protein
VAEAFPAAVLGIRPFRDVAAALPAGAAALDREGEHREERQKSGRHDRSVSRVGSSSSTVACYHEDSGGGIVEPDDPEPDATSPEEDAELLRAQIGAAQWIKHARNAFILGVVLHVSFLVGDEIAFTQLPPNSIWLAPGGWGFFWDAVTGLGAVTAFAVFYTLPAFMARPWIGWTLRACLFLVFVVFLTAQRADKYVGAIPTPTDLTLVRSYPFPSATLSAAEIREVTVRDTGIVKALSLRRNNHALDFIAVWHSDTVANAELQRLVSVLDLMQRQVRKGK